VEASLWPASATLVWGLFCQEPSAGGLSFFIVSFFVRFEGPFLRPDPLIPMVVARRSCQGRRFSSAAAG
jgi:hypothetical protein